MAEELRAAALDLPGVAHGFAPAGRAVAAGFRLVRVRQVHGSAVAVVDARTPGDAGEADALVTASPGLALAVATADCVPLLLASADPPAAAAVHAGWRGTLAGIAPRAVERVCRTFGVRPEALRAGLGPAIGPCCFEVEREIAERFAGRLGEWAREAWRERGGGKGTLDLRCLNARLLERAGLAADAIEQVGPCTACGGGPFASYRAQGPGAGRQLSWIALSPRARDGAAGQ